jgi:hypothetical protein
MENIILGWLLLVSQGERKGPPASWGQSVLCIIGLAAIHGSDSTTTSECWRNQLGFGWHTVSQYYRVLNIIFQNYIMFYNVL